MLLLAPFAAFCLSFCAFLLAATGTYDQAHGIYRWGPVPSLGIVALFLVAWGLGYMAGRARN